MTEDLIDIVLKNNVHYVKKRNTNQFFDLKYFEDFLKRQKLEFLSIKDMVLENSRIPTIAQSFYEALVYDGRILTQKAFANYYFKKNCVSISDQLFTFRPNKIGGYNTPKKSFHKISLQSRLYRAYPSLIRDFHFFLLCNTSKKFDDVKFSLKEDFSSGCDLTVIIDQKEIKARLFITTKRSLEFLNKKHRLHDFEGIFVDLPLDMSKAKSIGDFKVYDNTHVNMLLKTTRVKS